jgi:hypothetical protein
VTITNINNNSSTTINRSSTTINTRPAGGRGPFVNVVTPRGPGINGRGPVIINTGPRVLPGLVGGTVVAGGFLPPVTFVRPVPVINVVTAAPDVVPVPVYVPQPVAAVPADPNAGAVAVAPAGPEASTGPTQQAAAVVQTARYLRVKNNTGEGLRVFVQHYSQTANGEWAWLPKDPRTSTQAEEYRVAPGTDAVLGTPNGALAAHAVRLWAVSDSGREWVDYKNADLPLVPEQDPAGNRYYQAETIGTFTLNFDA